MRALLVAALLLTGAQAAPAAAQPTVDTPQLPHIIGGRLNAPTDRYGHRVLGGRGEHSSMLVFVKVADLNGAGVARSIAIRLPRDRVFEDVKVRAADVTGDGQPEAIVVESSASGGAQLAVYAMVDEKGEEVAKLASTPHIGRRNRWLAPAGIADFDGDGQNDIAYVETPHIGGTLRIWTMRDGKLVQIASKSGFSNHRIGEDFITGGVRDCGQGPELVLPNFNWSRLMVARMTNDGIATRAIGTKTGKAAVDAALACQK